MRASSKNAAAEGAGILRGGRVCGHVDRVLRDLIDERVEDFVQERAREHVEKDHEDVPAPRGKRATDNRVEGGVEELVGQGRVEGRGCKERGDPVEGRACVHVEQVQGDLISERAEGLV